MLPQPGQDVLPCGNDTRLGVEFIVYGQRLGSRHAVRVTESTLHPLFSESARIIRILVDSDRDLSWLAFIAEPAQRPRKEFLGSLRSRQQQPKSLKSGALASAVFTQESDPTIRLVERGSE